MEKYQSKSLLLIEGGSPVNYAIPILEKLGFANITITRDVTEGISIIQEEKVDVILCSCFLYIDDKDMLLNGNLNFNQLQKCFFITPDICEIRLKRVLHRVLNNTLAQEENWGYVAIVDIEQGCFIDYSERGESFRKSYSTGFTHIINKIGEKFTFEAGRDGDGVMYQRVDTKDMFWSVGFKERLAQKAIEDMDTGIVYIYTFSSHYSELCRIWKYCKNEGIDKENYILLDNDNELNEVINNRNYREIPIYDLSGLATTKQSLTEFIKDRANYAKKTILHAGDDEEQAEYCIKNLQELGFSEITNVQEEKAALDEIHKKDFDLIVCNYKYSSTPNLLPFYNKLREYAKVSSIPVIYLEISDYDYFKFMGKGIKFREITCYHDKISLKETIDFVLLPERFLKEDEGRLSPETLDLFRIILSAGTGRTGEKNKELKKAIAEIVSASDDDREAVWKEAFEKTKETINYNIPDRCIKAIYLLKERWACTALREILSLYLYYLEFDKDRFESTDWKMENKILESKRLKIGVDNDDIFLESLY